MGQTQQKHPILHSCKGRTKKLCVCLWACVRVDLPNRSGTVSSEATRDMGYWIWSIHRICILTWTLPWWFWKLVALFGSFVWFLFSSFQAIASTHEIWSGNTVPRHLVCQCCVQVCGWVGDLLIKALKLCFGVSFGYRFGIVFPHICLRSIVF